ncbi:nucleoside 2-deoxyribosyltransferase [Dactylosporangium sp. CA-152071]|uniref:nucleoside 2-deoxyribosyltransferase n=1 Tax=Dactylosporangium sp. CA-152071 TaxID=3239933 RepID=UPI003D8B86A4
MYYVAHRLFAAHDRRIGGLAAAALADRIGEDQIFLPFCDTDEENLHADVKGRRLYELDRERLDHLDGMLAILHGPSLDDGVCMEIGYAAHRGVPVVVLTTDFQTYGGSEQGPELAFPDPLLQLVAPQIIRAPRLGPLRAGRNRFTTYMSRNDDQLQAAVDRAVDALVGTIRLPAGTRPAGDPTTAFYEPNPYAPCDTARATTIAGIPVANTVSASRHGASADPSASARNDWDALHRAGTLLVDVRGPETPPGAAIMIGASRATGRRIIVLTNAGGWTFADGREPNYRNLMIQYAADQRHELAWREPTGRRS